MIWRKSFVLENERSSDLSRIDEVPDLWKEQVRELIGNR